MVALYELMDILPDSFVPNFTERQNELFVFLKDHKKQLSEREAAAQFLKSFSRKQYFNKLKNGLKQAIIEHIMLNPSLWRSASYKAIYEDCYTSFAAYKILLMNGKRRAAMEMAKTLLKKLQKIELHSLIYTVAMDLSFYYASVNGSPSLVEKYTGIMQSQMEILQAESIVRACHNKMCLTQTKRESYNDQSIETLKDIAEQVRPFLKLNSYYLNRFIYNIIIYSYLTVFDYRKVIELSDEALSRFPTDHPNYNAIKFGYFQTKIPALVALGQLEEAKVIAKASCQMMSPGGFNWHLAFIRRCIVCLHAGEYQEAYELYKVQAKHKCPFPTLHEYWSIIWGYLYFLIKIKRIQAYTKERFQLAKFINEVPIYSKDKAGNNINILVIQILIRMQREQYGQIIDKVDALSTYASSYTKNPETTRANLFIKMILRMESASFHRKGTERKTQELLEEMKNTPLKLKQNLAVEIIPFETLWQEMLNLLENKFRAKTIKRTKI